MKWIYPEPVEAQPELETYLSGHPLVTNTLIRRGINTPDQARSFLHPEHYQPAPSTDLPDLDKAVDRVLRAVSRQETVGIWGDFDVDGQTSTAILFSAFQKLELKTYYYIPLRETESHGINIPGLQRFLEHNLDLLITCDTGVTEFDAVEFAVSQGVDVIITDHHELPPRLPEALAIINPNRLAEQHPLYTLPGAGVAYKLIEQIYARLGNDPTPYLDLVALAVVADVALQKDDTRYLLQKGLEQLRSDQRPGLSALYEQIKLDPQKITAQDIGFQIGPRLNALGRLDDANPGVEILTTADPIRAKLLALRLESLNKRRRQLTDEIFQSALDKLTNHPELLNDYSALILSDPGWHPGVIGIVASRLVERFQKPTFLFVEEGDQARGSARSLEGISIIDAVAEQSPILNTFGGHQMAAGMHLPTKNIPELRRQLSSSIQAQIADLEFEPALVLDGQLSLHELSLDLVDEISRLAPFGPGNPPLTLWCSNLTLAKAVAIGRDRSHRKLTVEDKDSNQQEVLWWNSSDLPLPAGRFDLAFTISDSTFRGERQLQLTLTDFRELEDPSSLSPDAPPRTKFIDLRKSPRPDAALEDIIAEHKDLFIWAEGYPPPLPQGFGRKSFQPSPNLIVWTIPPSHLLLKRAVEEVNPSTVFLFAQQPPLTKIESFIKILVGVIKPSLTPNRNSTLDLERLAEATAQSESTIRKGLVYLENRGFLKILNFTDSHAAVLPGDNTAAASLEDSKHRLITNFNESKAYRLNYLSAPKDLLL
ncbi:MAG: single-stranded-DNA-specific exonuclease RecJ [Anaerolineales bacterium]|nr:single-stranded-DNA-specific exonuclease RecJ [Anaerolineales bacterium]